jgi:hypothetical protein
MGGACSNLWGKERCIQDFGGKNLTERDHVEDIRMDGY